MEKKMKPLMLLTQKYNRLCRFFNKNYMPSFIKEEHAIKKILELQELVSDQPHIQDLFLLVVEGATMPMLVEHWLKVKPEDKDIKEESVRKKINNILADIASRLNLRIETGIVILEGKA
jgi:hypothetical protein